MIIKFTFYDNDYTQVIQEFFEEGGIFNSNNFRTMKDIVSFKENINNYSDIIDTKYKKKIEKEIINAIKNIFTIYISNINENSKWSTTGYTARDIIENKEYILKKLEISIVEEISDIWQNGEVLYYITSNDKYLVM